MNLQPINALASPETQMNDNAETLDHQSVYGKRQPVTTGLTWGYCGGRWGGFAITQDVVTLTDASANYLVVTRSSGAVSVSAAATNWNDTANYARVYKITTAGGVVTAVEDHRAGPNGVHGSTASAGAGAELWTGDKTFGENVGLVLDPALSADGKYCGLVKAGIAGAALAFGEVCYLAVADSRWEKAKADVAATSAGKLGLCVLAAAADGDPTVVLLIGDARADALYPAMTIGAPVYLSAATAGQVTSTAPTGTTDFVVRVIGFANTADELYFNPSADYLTLA